MKPSQEKLLQLLENGCRAAGPKLRPSSWTVAEWQEVVAEANRHQVASLLYHRLGRHLPAGAMPKEAWASLRTRAMLVAATNLRRFHSLTPVLVRLKAVGVPVIALKGVYLAAEVYDNVALRQMSDVDLLVRRQDLEKTDEVLAAAGFVRREHSVQPPQDVNEFHYLGDAGQLMVEIHWELLPPDYPFRLDVEAMWAKALPVRIAGAEALAFAPEDQLIHLGVHAAIHRFGFGLRSLCDIAELVAKIPVDGSLLVERAVKMGVMRSVGVSLVLARDLLRAAVPADVIEALLPVMPGESLWREARSTVLGNTRQGVDGSRPNPNLVLFVGCKRWRDRFVLLRRRLFPTRQMMAALYPVAVDSPRVWFYYPRVQATLVRRNLPALLAFVAGKIRRPTVTDPAAELMDWLMQSR